MPLATIGAFTNFTILRLHFVKDSYDFKATTYEKFDHRIELAIEYNWIKEQMPLFFTEIHAHEFLQTFRWKRHRRRDRILKKGWIVMSYFWNLFAFTLERMERVGMVGDTYTTKLCWTYLTSAYPQHLVLYNMEEKSY